VIACTGGTTVRPPPSVSGGLETQATFADENLYQPSYGKPELEKALITERAAEANAEHRVADLASRETDDELATVAADLAVRRRFIASLEACQAVGRTCPPRLDEPAWSFDVEGSAPPITAPLAFDIDGWRVIADELFGRACACRTIACIDSLAVAIDLLEARPPPEALGDDAATLSITRARECLFRLRGKTR